MYEYRARLMTRSNGRHPVYDGDTVWLEVDLGCGVLFALGACRLYGINTPEMRGSDKAAGVRARDYVRKEMSGVEWFDIKTHKDKKGKYGRYLVEICLPDNAPTLNERLVNLGHAVEYLP